MVNSQAGKGNMILTTKTVNSEPETRKHIAEVTRYVHMFVKQMLDRALQHDTSKLEEPEKSVFDEFTPKLHGISYGSPEYRACMDAMKVAIQHHQQNNDHHPEFHQDPYGNNLSRMDLFQIVEMLCDWMAATKRHHDGNIFRSIEINAGRFGINPQLVQILRNTTAKMNDMEVNGQ